MGGMRVRAAAAAVALVGAVGLGGGVLSLGAPQAGAATPPNPVWSGGAASGDPTWSTATNWSSTAPGAATTLGTVSFPYLSSSACTAIPSSGSPTATCYYSHNNTPGRSVTGLSFDMSTEPAPSSSSFPSGYSVSGTSLTVGAGGITMIPSSHPTATTGQPFPASADLTLPLTLSTSQTWHLKGPGNLSFGTGSSGSGLSGSGKNLTLDLSNSADAELGSGSYEVGTFSAVGSDTSLTAQDAFTNGSIGVSSDLNGNDGGPVELSHVALDAGGSSSSPATVGALTVVASPVEVACIMTCGTTSNFAAVLSATSATFHASSELSLGITEPPSSGTSGVAGTDNSELTSTGTVALGTANLIVGLQLATGAIAPVAGDMYTLVSAKTLTGAVSVITYGANGPSGARSIPVATGTTIPLNTELALDMHYNRTSTPETLTGTVVTATATAVTTSASTFEPTVAYGTTVTYTATVLPKTGTAKPAGEVAFTAQQSRTASASPTTLCTAMLATVSGTETATCHSTAAPAGEDTITGTYTPSAASAGVLGSSSGFSSQFVTYQVNVALSANGATTGAAAPAGGVVRYQAVLTDTSAGVSADPTGTVTFLDGGIPLCIAAAEPSATTNESIARCTATGAAAGPTTVSDLYDGAPQFAEGTSSPPKTSLDVSGTEPTVTLATSAGTSTVAAGSPVTYTATVSGSSGTPTGTVAVVGTFADLVSTDPLCTITLSEGTGTCIAGAPLVAGTTSTEVYGIYSGSTVYGGATDQASVTVTGDRTFTGTVTASSPSVSAGTSVTYSAQVGVTSFTSSSILPPPTGTVKFSVGSTTLCTGTFSGTPHSDAATATCTSTAAPAGADVVRATYAGETSPVDASGSSGDATVVVTGASTTTSVTVDGKSSATVAGGASVTYAATVSQASGTPSGSVTFDAGATTICTATLTSGSGSCTGATAPGGTDTVTGTYSGDSTADASAGTATLDVAGTATSKTTITVDGKSSATVADGAAVTYGATVNGASGTPTGTVIFRTGSTALCTAHLSSGAGTCQATTAPKGTDTVTGTYSGDTTYVASSGTATLTVTGTPSTTAVSVVTTGPYSYGQSIEYKATVTGAAGIPTGKVTFSVGGAALCTGVTLVSGTATCTVTSTPAGATEHLVADYPGNTTYGPSTGTAVLSVGKATTTTTVSFAAPSADHYGTTVMYSATVAPEHTGTSTGTVTVEAGGQEVCQIMLTTSDGGSGSCTSTTAPVGTTEPVAATYSGSSDFASSTGTAATDLSVAKATTSVTLKATPATPTVGQAVTITATVAPHPNAGTVTFTPSSGTLSCAGGDTHPVSTSGTSAGSATCTVIYDSTASSPQQVTATYGGSSDYAASAASSPVSVTVGKGTTTTSVSTGVQTVGDGSAVTYSATVSGPSSPPGLPTPTGKVSFSSGSVTMCSATLGTGSADTASASCTSTTAPAGNDTVDASYAGDTNWKGSSGTAFLTVLEPPAPPSGSTASASAISTSPSGSASAKTGNVAASGAGVGSLTVAAYSGNPTPGAVSDGSGAYYDVAVGTGSSFSSLIITVCNPGTGESLDWWNGSAWLPFSDQYASAGCLAATVTPTTSPTLAELTGTPVAVSTAPPPGASGYWTVASDGGIFSYGEAHFYGSMGGKPLNKPIVGMAATSTGKGYWEVASDGGIFTFGSASFHGSMGGKPLNAPIVGMATDSATGGYWEVASDGGIFSFDAPFYGSMGGKPLNKPIVGMAATSTGKGYWLVASDGGIFSFGGAAFYGSMGGTPLNKPVVAMSATSTGHGYWEVASDGGIFTFGSAKFSGSMGGTALNKPMVAMASTPATGGYWTVASDGGIFSFGGAQFYGSMGGKPLNKPMVGMASSTS